MPLHRRLPKRGFTNIFKKKFAIVNRAVEYFRARHDVIDVDGVRVLFGDGWGLIRASNTTPILVVRYEAKTKERLEEIRALIDGTIADAKKEIGG